MIIIDPGHGGLDNGIISNEIVEKEITLKISKIIFNKLKELGIPVILTRDNDITLNMDERINKINNNASNDSIIISNHVGTSSTQETGARIIYPLRSDDKLASLLSASLANAGLNNVEFYQRRLPSDTSKDYYEINRNIKKGLPIIIEYAFIDNIADASKLKENYEKYALAVANTLYNYVKQSNIYIVQKGDTLYSIANKYNTTVEKIKILNNLTKTTLSIGQKLVIPQQEAITDSYIVQKGDSLYSIANQYNTTVDNLKKTNNLSTNLLQIGQILKLPEEKENIYIVQKGDNLYTIANKYNITVKTLMDINDLKSNLLQIGQELIIPNNNIYIVQKGDSLYSIANKYNTTVEKLKSLNNLTSTILQINQMIKIS